MIKLDKTERRVLAVILGVVGVMAFVAAFNHVRSWTMENSPAGTHWLYGWTVALISELVPVAAGLAIRIMRRAKTTKGVWWAVLLLLAAASLSLAAQLAMAKPSITGWVLSAVPALAFMGLSKLVLALPGVPEPEPPHSERVAAVHFPTTEVMPTFAAGVSGRRQEVTVRLDDADGGVEEERPVKRVTARTMTLKRLVEDAVAKYPNAKPAVIAKVAGVSESTARRHMKFPSPSGA